MTLGGNVSEYFPPRPVPMSFVNTMCKCVGISSMLSQGLYSHGHELGTVVVPFVFGQRHYTEHVDLELREQASEAPVRLRCSTFWRPSKKNCT